MTARSHCSGRPRWGRSTTSTRSASGSHTGTMHAATPRSAPGAKTITTRELVELYKGSKPVLINVLDWTEGAFALPGTVWIQGMGKAQLSGSEYLELRS